MIPSLTVSFPIKFKFPVRLRTISGIKVGNTLVRDAYFIGDSLEIVDGILIDPDSDLLFQSGGIRIFLILKNHIL